MTILEQAIERWLAELTAKNGGRAVKLGLQGWPDRMVLLPGGVVGFLELKRPGEVPTPLQLKRLRDLTALGFAAEWTDSLGGVAAFMAKLIPER